MILAIYHGQAAGEEPRDFLDVRCDRCGTYVYGCTVKQLTKDGWRNGICPGCRWDEEPTAHQEDHTMLLRIHHPDAVIDLLYPIGDVADLEDAVEQEASTVAGAFVGSDLRESPDQDWRDELQGRIEREALSALRNVGDSYTDPTGVRWTLEED